MMCDLRLHLYQKPNRNHWPFVQLFGMILKIKEEEGENDDDDDNEIKTDL